MVYAKPSSTNTSPRTALPSPSVSLVFKKPAEHKKHRPLLIQLLRTVHWKTVKKALVCLSPHLMLSL